MKQSATRGQVAACGLEQNGATLCCWQGTGSHAANGPTFKAPDII